MYRDIAELTAGPPESSVAHVPADDLVSTVLDRDQEWWRRRICARALAGRVPADSAPALLDVVRDPAETAEIRVATLDVLPASDALLQWLRRHPDQTGDPLETATVLARARLGDATAAPQSCG